MHGLTFNRWPGANHKPQPTPHYSYPTPGAIALITIHRWVVYLLTDELARRIFANQKSHSISRKLAVAIPTDFAKRQPPAQSHEALTIPGRPDESPHSLPSRELARSSIAKSIGNDSTLSHVIFFGPPHTAAIYEDGFLGFVWSARFFCLTHDANPIPRNHVVNKPATNSGVVIPCSDAVQAQRASSPLTKGLLNAWESRMWYPSKARGNRGLIVAGPKIRDQRMLRL